MGCAKESPPTSELFWWSCGADSALCIQPVALVSCRALPGALLPLYGAAVMRRRWPCWLIINPRHGRCINNPSEARQQLCAKAFPWRRGGEMNEPEFIRRKRTRQSKQGCLPFGSEISRGGRAILRIVGSHCRSDVIEARGLPLSRPSCRLSGSRAYRPRSRSMRRGLCAESADWTYSRTCLKGWDSARGGSDRFRAG